MIEFILRVLWSGKGRFVRVWGLPPQKQIPKHVFEAEKNLNAGDDNFFNDKVSSIAVLESAWTFYHNSEMKGQYAKILGPGLYSSVGNVDIQNDDISSLEPSASIIRHVHARGPAPRIG